MYCHISAGKSISRQRSAHARHNFRRVRTVLEVTSSTLFVPLTHFCRSHRRSFFLMIPRYQFLNQAWDVHHFFLGPMTLVCLPVALPVLNPAACSIESERTSGHCIAATTLRRTSLWWLRDLLPSVLLTQSDEGRRSADISRSLPVTVIQSPQMNIDYLNYPQSTVRTFGTWY